MFEPWLLHYFAYSFMWNCFFFFFLFFNLDVPFPLFLTISKQISTENYVVVTNQLSQLTIFDIDPKNATKNTSPLCYRGEQKNNNNRSGEHRTTACRVGSETTITITITISISITNQYCFTFCCLRSLFNEMKFCSFLK